MGKLITVIFLLQIYIARFLYMIVCTWSSRPYGRLLATLQAKVTPVFLTSMVRAEVGGVFIMIRYSMLLNCVFVAKCV